MFWLYDLNALASSLCFSYLSWVSYFSISFIVILSRFTVLAFYENSNNPRLVKKKLLFIGGEKLLFGILLGWRIYGLVTTLYFPLVMSRYHLKPLLGFILQII